MILGHPGVIDIFGKADREALVTASGERLEWRTILLPFYGRRVWFREWAGDTSFEPFTEWDREVDTLNAEGAPPRYEQWTPLNVEFWPMTRPRALGSGVHIKAQLSDIDSKDGLTFYGPLRCNEFTALAIDGLPDISVDKVVLDWMGGNTQSVDVYLGTAASTRGHRGQLIRVDGVCVQMIGDFPVMNMGHLVQDVGLEGEGAITLTFRRAADA